MELLPSLELEKNTNIIAMSVLRELSRIADIRGDVHRSSAFLKAAMEIEKINNTGDTGQIIESRVKLPGVGTHIRAILDEIIRTGKCKELEELQTNDTVKAVDNLVQIMGIGTSSAYIFAKKGITNIAQLRAAVQSGRVALTHAQKLGLDYHEHLSQPIARGEVAKLGKMIIFGLSSAKIADAVIAGSYRRGAEQSSDIDIIVMFTTKEPPQLLPLLKDLPGFVGFVSRGTTRISFVIEHSKIVRLVDILLVAKKSFAPALLYFTGNYQFNEAMRGYAKSRGYLLNQDGLYKLSARKSTLVPATTEADIFRELGLKFVEPANRMGANAVIAINSA